VLGRPFDRETQGARWKSPIEDLKAPNRDLDLEFTVHREISGIAGRYGQPLAWDLPEAHRSLNRSRPWREPYPVDWRNCS